jgi:putative SOS response-associated peptidase YedK
MPVIIPREHWAQWLDRSLQDPAALAPLMPPTDPAGMLAWPVSRTVNRGSAEGESLVEPMPEVG